MAHESFEDPATAALMNELFVNVKVDREERPDVDSLYMDAVVALTGQRRLADDRLPHARRRAVPRRHVLPARAAARTAELSRRCCARSSTAYRERRGDVDAAGAGADRLRARVGARSRPSREPLTSSLLHEAVRGLALGLRRALGRLGAARRSSRRRRRSSSCCGAASSSRRRRRSTGWRSAACTTCSAAASTATRSTSAGSCRTSRRCSTTTRCSCPRTCTAGS